MKRDVARATAVVVVFATSLYLLRGLLAPICWAGVIAIGSWPLHERLMRLTHGWGDGVSAALLTAAAMLLVVLPFAWLVHRGLHELPLAIRVVEREPRNRVDRRRPGWTRCRSSATGCSASGRRRSPRPAPSPTTPIPSSVTSASRPVGRWRCASAIGRWRSSFASWSCSSSISTAPASPGRSKPCSRASSGRAA